MSRPGLLAGETGLGAPVARSSADVRLAPFIASHFDFVWQLLRRFGLPPADADDAAQQVFMILARRLDKIAPGRERAFVYGTTRRVFSNARRARRRRREEPNDELSDAATEMSLPDALVEQRRARTLLDALLSELPSPLRRVIVLAEIEGLSVPEIADLEGVPLGTASSRLRRARAGLRALLAEARSKNPFDPVSG